jgi:hypothetical protein
MARLGLTEPERNYVARMAAVRESRYSRVGFYSAVLVPAFGFGVYGLLRADVVALGLGFAALAYFSLWRIAGEVRHAPTFFSICRKIAESERDDRG